MVYNILLKNDFGFTLKEISDIRYDEGLIFIYNDEQKIMCMINQNELTAIRRVESDES